MEILLQFVLLAVGFVMLVKGADWFVDGAAGVADRFGVPQLVIGLTIVAMGTSAPEAAVSITAALKGNAGITIGNVVGSNILNILIILGLTSVIIATAVAKAKVPVLIFSLEMSKEQMVNRILCSEAQVDSMKVRTGKLETDDWVKLGKASGDLAETPIYIDDTPGLSS